MGSTRTATPSPTATSEYSFGAKGAELKRGEGTNAGYPKEEKRRTGNAGWGDERIFFFYDRGNRVGRA